MRHTGRTYAVTGADSGIGAATVDLLRRDGATVIACGTGDHVDVRADLTTRSGRKALVAAVRRLAPRLHGVATGAGTGAATPDGVRLNYFGTVEVLDGLHGPLAETGGRAVAVTSASALSHGDATIVDSCLSGNEDHAVQAARIAVDRRRGGAVYRSTKIAVNRWVRRSAPTWAETGVTINAVAPGVVDTETARRTILADPIAARVVAEALPQPLGFPGPPEAVAEAISWLLSPTDGFTTGQVVFVDGGADATLRGDEPYADGVRYGPVATARMLWWTVAGRLRRR
ncbi:SDR family oxidoreductase [Stackebrandtia soli]|uniref:SDR family oxidoreductase n=1 Tax=Stackebrandtia soli TaxID=1892856 RepID=UPI0039EB3F2A